MSANTEVYDRTLNCVALFNQCAANTALRKLNWVEKCQADFNLWAYGLKAISTGKSSLDYRVRQREDVRGVICDLLDGLADSLQNCLEASSEPDGVEDLEFDIKTVLKQLSRIHVAIRRAGIQLRHQRADAGLADALKTTDFTEWKSDMENCILMGIENQSEKQGFEEGRFQHFVQKRTLSKVQERLIRANLLRRHRIQYTRAASKEAKQKDAKRILEEARKAPPTRKLAQESVQLQSQPTNAGIQQKDQLRHSAESHLVNKPSASDNQRTATDLPSKLKLPLTTPRKSATIITKGTETGQRQNYPRWRKRSKGLEATGNVLCPYCSEPLSQEYTSNDIRWRFVSQISTTLLDCANVALGQRSPRRGPCALCLHHG